MIFRKTSHEDGDYVDNEGQRWIVEYLRCIHTPEGLNVGWTEFPSLTVALETWGLKFAAND